MLGWTTLVDVVEYTTPDGVTLWVRNTEYDDDRYSNAEVRTYDIGTDPVRTCLDIGAHIGSFTCYIKHLYPDAEIVAIEPEPGNFEVLAKNVTALPDVQAIQSYMGQEQAVVILIHDSHTTCHQMVLVSQVAHNQITVPAPPFVTLESIIAEQGWETVDLVKIDAEGAEIPLINNTPDEVLKKIYRLVGEHHNGYQAFIEGIGARLMALGFEVWGQQDPNAHSTFWAVNQNLVRLDFGETLVDVEDKATATNVQFEIPERTTIVSGEAPAVTVKAERRPQPKAKTTTRKAPQRSAATKGKVKKK